MITVLKSSKTIITWKGIRRERIPAENPNLSNAEDVKKVLNLIIILLDIINENILVKVFIIRKDVEEVNNVRNQLVGKESEKN